jgi:hypothetical protein
LRFRAAWASGDKPSDGDVYAERYAEVWPWRMLAMINDINSEDSSVEERSADLTFINSLNVSESKKCGKGPV